MKNLTDSRKSIRGNRCGSAPEVVQDYTLLVYRFALKSCLRKINEFDQSVRFE